ncbi:MAG: M20/M25/M40 family metallo-hydrolase [Acidobacteria bacterium]|nr:M20/M25/M40 family metallo-hydrolase [Acidobacteriota bacterium]
MPRRLPPPGAWRRRAGHGALALVTLVCAAACSPLPASVAARSGAQTGDAVRAAAQAEREPMIATMRDLVSIESGSRDAEGLREIASLIADRLRAVGGDVELVSHDDPYVMVDTPEEIGQSVVARFRGSGTGRILLLAHMDTVYLRGQLAEQPFRITDGRAYGLGIVDDKQGIALILHVLSVLRALEFDDYELITVLINGDEEVSSAGSRFLITRLGAEHDVVFSCEGGGSTDRLALTTAGIGAVLLKVTGRASHAGGAPERGRNALYELAHQVLQMSDLSDPRQGIKLNWTIASAGATRNVIPAEASATADYRVLRVASYDVVERRVRERIRNQLIPGTTVEVTFERRRPPLEVTRRARRLAAHAQSIYRELGRELGVSDQAAGGGTDAAFAALENDGAVIEGLGLVGFGAHSDTAEYVELSSIEPRIYLLSRLIMDVARGDAP